MYYEKIHKRAEKICTKLGIKYLGYLKVPIKYKGLIKELIGFHDTITNDTIYIKADEFTYEHVKTRLNEKRRAFGYDEI